ncbi:telomeric repeat-binding factor 1 [Lates japonicus]
MEHKINNTTATEASYNDESASFSHVTTVATGWMLDFLFVSLCRRFKEGKLDEFNEMLSAFEAISQSPWLKEDLYGEKTMICAFLARVMHGKQLDVQFEEDDHVMPLMSAAEIWSKLKDTVEDESMFKNIKILLLVQTVAVCLEKGKRSSASSALKWLENNHDFPQNLGVKLKTIVTQRETYHPFLMSFSFSRLQETIQSYLDAYLEKNPSDYLLKAATKKVLSSQNTEGLEDVVTHDSSHSETANKPEANKAEKHQKRKRKKLLSTKITDVWKPDSCKKPCVAIRRLSPNEISPITSEESRDNGNTQKRRKPPEKWTPQLDKYLKDGVKRHGVGKWSLILMDYDFQGRTGTMLKDRWRVLVRGYQVG